MTDKEKLEKIEKRLNEIYKEDFNFETNIGMMEIMTILTFMEEKLENNI